MQPNTPPRPKWNSRKVQEEAALSIADEVRDWAIAGGFVMEDAPKQEFRALVVIAILESPDSYQAARYVEDFYEWPSDRQLIDIFDKAYSKMKNLVTKHVHAWVMENNVRFPANAGEGVVVRIGQVEFKAQVVAVISREARAIVNPVNNPTKNMPVSAEEVLRKFKIKDKKKDDIA